MSVGERIRIARKRADLTQSQLGELIGITQQALGQIENGETQNTTYLLPIARALNVDPFWLESGNGSESLSDNVSLNISNQELKLIATFRCLSESNQEVFLKILKALDD